MENLIGVVYKTRGKHPRLCTVVDKLDTYNSKGELVRTRYVSEHEFLGQIVTNSDVCRVTILRGKVEEVA
jgi:hypothetical protein